jgi:dienelactone hydrolase
LVYFHGAISPCFKTIPSFKSYTGSPVEETGLIPFCRSRGIALLVPWAKYEYTHRGCTSVGWMIAKEIDGVEKIIDTVTARFNIDDRRIYLAGFCAGAVFSHHLANRRPRFCSGIVSHSQAHISWENELLKPAEKGPQFGVVFCYTKGDLRGIDQSCIESEKIYRGEGYRTALLPYLRPRRHAWSFTSDKLIWNTLLQVGRK